VTFFLADRPAALIAIDPDPAAIEEARRVVTGVDFRIGSGEKLDFPNRWFDLVLFTLSLHHQDSKRALQEAQRVLKKDGEILVIEPDAEGEVERVFAVVHNEDAAKQAAQQRPAQAAKILAAGTNRPP
jgi:ubiquinone/menaquinone biosynthesis C-methylase UbiE